MFRGADFRPEYRAAASLRSVFSSASCACLSATVTSAVLNDVLKILQLCHKDVHISALPPDRPNIYLEIRRADTYSLQQLGWLADELETKQLGCPKTVVFATSINTVSEIYSWLMYQLKEKAYVSNTIHPKDSIVSMFHGHISPALQQHILEQFRNSTSTIRLLVCTIAFGMGIEVKDIKRVVHWGKVQSILAYWQEVGRCGRDGLPAQAIWYPTSVAGQDHEVLKKMRDNQQCIRKTMLQAFKITDSEEQEELSNCQLDSCVQRSCHLCSCCSHCRETCQCGVLEE